VTPLPSMGLLEASSTYHQDLESPPGKANLGERLLNRVRKASLQDLNTTYGSRGLLGARAGNTRLS
jgi:hypothetical protein